MLSMADAKILSNIRCEHRAHNHMPIAIIARSFCGIYLATIERTIIVSFDRIMIKDMTTIVPTTCHDDY